MNFRHQEARENRSAVLPAPAGIAVRDERGLTAGGEPDDVHIFNPFKNFNGGSERAALELAREIRRYSGARVKLWRLRSHYDRRCDAEDNIHHAHPLHFPLGGTFIFIGAYWKLKPWIALTRPARVRVIINTNDLDNFSKLRPVYHRLSTDVRYFFRCRLQRTLYGVDGPIRPSSIDLARFAPAPGDRPQDGLFRVGRISRDTIEKHHYLYDPELYCKLAQEGFHFRILGGTCLEPLLPARRNIELLPAGAVDAADFCRSLDCFFFRTGTFYDTFARTVFEAMASGLPVICDRFGGYSEYIQHGRNGLLFDGQQQAMELLREVRHNRELRLNLGAAARRTAERMFGEEAARSRVSELLA